MRRLFSKPINQFFPDIFDNLALKGLLLLGFELAAVESRISSFWIDEQFLMTCTRPLQQLCDPELCNRIFDTTVCLHQPSVRLISMRSSNDLIFDFCNSIGRYAGLSFLYLRGQRSRHQHLLKRLTV